jgi:hypothetical protein
MEATLERMEISTLPVETPDFTELAKKAREQLGYHVASHQTNDTTILLRLIAIGYTPYSEKSVKLYKRTAERKANDVFGKLARCVLFTLSGVASFVLAAEILEHSVFGIVLALSSVCLIFFGIWLVSTIPVSMVSWYLGPLSTYDKPIPTSVLAKALSIKEKFKRDEIGLYVDALGAVDPFLVVGTASGKKFYIDVWDEPSFENVQQENVSGK